MKISENASNSLNGYEGGRKYSIIKLVRGVSVPRTVTVKSST